MSALQDRQAGSPVPRPACLPEHRPWPPRSVGGTPVRLLTALPAACPDGRVRVTGVLLHDAELRHAPGGADAPSELYLHMSTGQGNDYIVRQMVRNEPLALRAADAKARALLRRGQTATVTARGVKAAHSDYGSPVLLLTDVLDVAPHATAPDGRAPTQAAE